MATTSTVPAVKGALLAQLTTAAAGIATAANPVQVTYSNPGDKRIAGNIYLGKTHGGRNDFAVMRNGRKKREEEYWQAVEFEFHRGGDYGDAAETAALAAFALLEDLIANDPQLGLGATEPTLRALVSDYEMGTNFDMMREGWTTKLVASVNVKVRLS